MVILPLASSGSVKVEVAALGPTVRNKPTVSVDVKQHFNQHQAELRSCVTVEVAAVGSPVPNKPMVSVEVKQY